MGVSFFVAYFDGEVLVSDPGAIRHHYLWGRFWLDLITTIPFELIILGAMKLEDSESTTARFISLMRLLRLVSCQGLLPCTLQEHRPVMPPLPAAPAGASKEAQFIACRACGMCCTILTQSVTAVMLSVVPAGAA